MWFPGLYTEATLALSIVQDATERGAMVITAMAFSVFEPWLGVLVGIIVITALCGFQVFIPKKDISEPKED